MALLNEALDEDTRAQKIMGILDQVEQDAAPEPEPAQGIPAAEAANTGAEETPPTQEEPSQGEPAKPAIEPPKFLKAEYRTRWSELSTDWQRYLAQQEEENSRTVSTKLDEAAAIRKASEEATRNAEAIRKTSEERAAALLQEQQRYAQSLTSLVQQVELLDPVVAKYRQTDLVKLAQESPAEYTQLDAAYRQRMSALQALENERIRATSEARNALFDRENKFLISKVPEWSDPEVGPKQLAEVRQGAMKHYGFSEQEAKAVADHRQVLMARDALAYHKLKAEFDALKASVDADKAKAEEAAKAAKQAIEAKKVAPAVKPVLKPQAVNDSKDKAQTDRSKAILKQAKNARSTHDKAALIAQIV